MFVMNRRELLRGGAAAVGLCSLVARKLLARGIEGASAPQHAQYGFAAVAPRERLLLDFDWKFVLGHAGDPSRDLGFGANLEELSKTVGFDFATEKFDDSRWRSLNLPHDWAVELPFVHDEALQSHGYKPLGRNYPETSIGWYRRAFDIPAGDFGRRIVLEFDGAFRRVLVFLNGSLIGRHDSGYTPFRFDISDFVNYGGRNILVVRVDATSGEGWFYEGAGIYRHVWLTKTEALHLAAWETCVRTDVRPDAAVLSLATVVENQGIATADASVRWKILDAQGRIVATARSRPQSVTPAGNATFKARVRLESPALWAPETPYLYSALVSVESGGRAQDAERVAFGVRTIAFDAAKGFFLNGKSVKIKGTCNHQDHAGVGVALPDALQWYRLSVLRAMGSNAVRTSHNMPTPEWVAACERMGMMMMCETRRMSSTPEGLSDLEVMIKRYRNSPAIILWSMGNEEWALQNSPEGAHIVASMVRRAHELDPTRPSTAAVNGSYRGGVSSTLDVEGFNYNLGAIDAYHRGNPRQPLVGSETASTICTRGIYETDPLRNWVSAYDMNHTSWSELAEEWWKFYAAREYLPGGFAWTGFDYRGEPTPYGWPSINSQFGIVDTCGFPKDNFFYYKSWWGREPVLHLFPHWNWAQRLGEPVSVWVHTNLEEVELFLNGRSQGRRKVRALTHLEWQVKYEPGVIEARGMKNGMIVMTTRRETTGEPATIRLSCDRSEIAADGEDIAIVRVEVLDNTGRTVPTAVNLIKFELSGEGTLLGVGNGDPNCQESDKQPMRSVFNGLAQLIVQATRNPGALVIEAYAEEFPGPKLPRTRLAITTRKSPPRPAIA
ncbi:MAG TPA: beta-galactosidase GalA [Steroidobacteraceae bacterium]|nr:beta-galactosidase GalA [Steroidobacteraceae bacterium]